MRHLPVGADAQAPAQATFHGPCLLMLHRKLPATAAPAAAAGAATAAAMSPRERQYVTQAV